MVASEAMPVIVALLRAVNVGGNNKLPMARLRAICQALGFERPETFIQSGNVLFESEDTAAAERLEEAIHTEFGFRPAVVLRSVEELRNVVARNPFAEQDKARVLVSFLQSDPGEEVREAVRAISVAPEELWIAGREMWVYYPDGQGRTKLPMARIERMLGCAATSRNVNTVEKLLALAEAR